MATACSWEVSACEGFLRPPPCGIIAGFTDRLCMHWDLSAATSSKASFQIGGNSTILVVLGSVNQIAAMLRIIDPVLGFFSGSVMTMGSSAYWALSRPMFSASLAAYWVSAMADTGDTPQKLPPTRLSGADSTGTRSHQFGLRFKLRHMLSPAW